MSFAGTAARGSAIPSPTLGMYTHLEDTPARTEFWNGSAWVSPFGMTLLNTTTFTSATSVSINNVFTSAYDNYKIILNVTSSPNNTNDVHFRARSSGTDFSSNVYRSGILYFGVTDGAALNVFQNLTQTLHSMCNLSDVLGGVSDTTLFSPFLSQRTAIRSISTGALFYDRATIINSTNSFDGFSLFPSASSMTGTVRVYGLRN